MEGFELYQSKKWYSPTALCRSCRCKRYYFYSEGCNLSTPSKAAALIFGGCIHRGIPYAIKGDIDRALQEFLKEWKAEYQDEKRNILRAKAMFEDFYNCHKEGRSIYTPLPAPINRMNTPEHNSEYEVPFAIDIGLDVPFVGLVDCLATHKDTGKKWVVEMKTSSELGQQFIQSFGMNPQVLSYALAMKILLGEDIEGVFVEGLLVAKTSCNTIIIPVYVKDFIVEEVLFWIKRKFLEIKECEEKQDFPKDFSGCNQYAMFGRPGYTCPYQSLCETTSNWTDLLDMYVIEPRKDKPF